MSGLKIWITRSSVISLAPAIEFLARFARTAVLSRLLPSTEFGTAVAINVVIGTVALITDMAIYKFVMARPNNEQALAAGHLVSIIRGLLIAIVIAFSAPIVASSFGVPQYSTSFALLAVVPFVQSFSHLGVRQVEGNYDYSPETFSQLFAHLSALIVVVPAVYFLRDHRAMIISLFAEYSVYTAISHIVARKAYRVRSDSAMLLALLSFGTPLMINGVGLAMVSQLDRAFIGNRFDVSTLALYAVILSMSTVPISIVDRVFGKMALSYLISKGRDALSQSYQLLIFIFSMLATAYSLSIAISLDVLTPLIFGSHFVVTPSEHVLMTLRVFFVLQTHGAPTSLFSATGRSTELAFLNFSSAIGVILSIFLVYFWPSIAAVMLGLLISDIIRFPFFFIVAGKKDNLDWRSAWGDLATSCFVLAVIAGMLTLKPALTWEARGIVFCVGVTAICVQFALGLRRHSKLRALFVH